jgi:hypothetical protein
MDEFNPSITEVKLKACIVAIYVTGLGIGHGALGMGYGLFLSHSLTPSSPSSPSSPQIQ